MDLYCQKCGEDWDFWYVQDQDGMNDDTIATDSHWPPPGQLGAETPAKAFKRGLGCPACAWGESAPAKRPMRATLAGVAADILGDDVDGIAGMMDDAEWMGLFEEPEE